MSTLEDLDDMEREGKEEKKDKDSKDGKKPDQDGDAEMKDADGDKKEEKEEELIDTEILHSSTRDINMRRRLLDNDMRIMKSEFQRLTHEQAAMKEKIKDNLDKIENNRYILFTLPVGNLLTTPALQTTPLLSRQCSRAPGPRRRERSSRRRRKHRPRRYTRRKIRRH